MGRPRRTGDLWLWKGGPVPPGADGITLGRLVIVTRRAAQSSRFDTLLLHESVHVRQFGELGVWGFLVRYIGAYLRWRSRGYSHWAAYRRIPLEVEAVWETRCARSARSGPDAGAFSLSSEGRIVP